MELVRQAQTILELEQNSKVSDNDWNDAKAKYLRILKQSDNPNEIRQVLQMNTELLMPIDLTIATYEKGISMYQDATLLREFASYLYLHGPDWDDYAADLEKKAQELDE